MSWPPARFHLFVLALLLLTNAALFAGWSWGWLSIQEDEGIEILQIVILCVGCVVFVAASFGNRTRLETVFFLSMALLTVSFMIRELDVEDYDVPEWIILIGSGKTKRIWQAALWIIILIWFGTRPRQTIRYGLQWMKGCCGIYLVPAAILMVLSWLIDADVIPDRTGTTPLIEELVEVDAYLLIVLTGCISLRRRHLLTAPQ